jgi:hypothetical protein
LAVDDFDWEFECYQQWEFGLVGIWIWFLGWPWKLGVKKGIGFLGRSFDWTWLEFGIGIGSELEWDKRTWAWEDNDHLGEGFG